MRAHEPSARDGVRRRIAVRAAARLHPDRQRAIAYTAMVGCFVILGALTATTIGTFSFHSWLLAWLNRPLPPGHRHVLTLGVAEPFTVALTVSLYAGVVTTSSSAGDR